MKPPASRLGYQRARSMSQSTDPSTKSLASQGSILRAVDRTYLCTAEHRGLEMRGLVGLQTHRCSCLARLHRFELKLEKHSIRAPATLRVHVTRMTRNRQIARDKYLNTWVEF